MTVTEENKVPIPKDSLCYPCRFAVGGVKALKSANEPGDPRVLISIVVHCLVKGIVPLIKKEGFCSKYKPISPIKTPERILVSRSKELKKLCFRCQKFKGTIKVPQNAIYRGKPSIQVRARILCEKYGKPLYKAKNECRFFTPVKEESMVKASDVV